MEKTILIVCGTGVASSAIMNNAVQELLERNKLDSKVILCRYSQMKHYLPQADLVIASLAPPEQLERPVIMGTGFLTGVGVDQLEQDILRQLCPA
ncbi:MAG: PTS sugar transporter subunit IIB [Oscillospiraceae bacterium]|nr:PTS sugar transporter subunit IIB [Oscillospiraceae bacterium]